MPLIDLPLGSVESLLGPQPAARGPRCVLGPGPGRDGGRGSQGPDFAHENLPGVEDLIYEYLAAL